MYLYNLHVECETNGGPVNGQSCKFPFTYHGATYSHCIKYDNDCIPWCSTEVNADGNHIDGKWGNCNENCDIGIDKCVMW